MTQAAAIRPRALTLRALRWEQRQTSLLPVIAVALFVGGLGALTAAWSYHRYEGAFAAQDLTWEVVLLQGAQLPCTLFLPAGLAVFAAVDAARAQRARRWQRARSLDRAEVLLRAQFLRNLQRAAVTVAVLVVTLAATAVFLGFSRRFLDGGLVVLLGRGLAAVFCCWCVQCVITTAGLWVREFAGLAALGLFGTILGLASKLVLPDAGWAVPFATPAGAMVAASIKDLISPVNMAGWALAGLAWTALSYAVARRRAARMEV